MLDLKEAHRLEQLIIQATDEEQEDINGSILQDIKKYVVCRLCGISSCVLIVLFRLVRKSDDLVLRSFDLLMEKMKSTIQVCLVGLNIL